MSEEAELLTFPRKEKRKRKKRALQKKRVSRWPKK
jgi:hypothetical protein